MFVFFHWGIIVGNGFRINVVGRLLLGGWNRSFCLRQQSVWRNCAAWLVYQAKVRLLGDFAMENKSLNLAGDLILKDSLWKGNRISRYLSPV